MEVGSATPSTSASNAPPPSVGNPPPASETRQVSRPLTRMQLLDQRVEGMTGHPSFERAAARGIQRFRRELALSFLRGSRTSLERVARLSPWLNKLQARFSSAAAALASRWEDEDWPAIEGMRPVLLDLEEECEDAFRVASTVATLDQRFLVRRLAFLRCEVSGLLNRDW